MRNKPKNKMISRKGRPEKIRMGRTGSQQGVSQKSPDAGASRPIDAAEARKRLENLVTASSVEIMSALVEAAKQGKVAEAKYLFEVAGVFPCSSEPTFKPENSLAYGLLKRLGLPTELPKLLGEDLPKAQS